MPFEDFLHCQRCWNLSVYLVSTFRQTLQLLRFYSNVNHCLIPLVIGELKRLSLTSLNSLSSSSSS